MKKYFFYTQPSILSSQTPSQAFGPILNGDSAYISGKDRYRCTHLHSISGNSEKPAIAVCDGLICVQPDDHNTYSIILKPEYQPSIDFPFIQYFIYKGIDESSLFMQSALNNNNNIPFIKRFFDDDKNNITNCISDSQSGEITGKNFNNSVSFPINGTPTQIFDDQQPMDNLFYYPDANFQLPRVKAGEKIGAFANDFGFEIVLQRLGFEPKISLARTFENIISVDSLNSSQTYADDDADFFLHWDKKEKCLCHIDPSAFYGSFCGSKVFYKDASGNTQKCNSPEEIYQNVLNNFVNKNKIYLDIRNDYGNSLNYYKNYGADIRFENKDASQSVTLNTTRDLWPILSLDINDFTSAYDIKSRNRLSTYLALPNNYLSKPLVYLSRAFRNNFRNLKEKHKSLLLENETHFTENFSLVFCFVDDSGNDVLLSAYYKINLYDFNRDKNLDRGNLAPSKFHYLDGLFRPLDMISTLKIKGDNFYFTIWHEELLVNESAKGGPAFIGYVGIAQDDYSTTLFACARGMIKGNIGSKLSKTFTTWTSEGKSSNKMFIEEIFDIFPNKELTKQTNKISLNNALYEVDSMIVINVPAFDIGSVFRKKEFPEDYVFFILDKAKYEYMCVNFQSVHPLHTIPLYLKIENQSIEDDLEANKYGETSLEAESLHKVNAKIEQQNIVYNSKIFDNGNL